MGAASLLIAYIPSKTFSGQPSTDNYVRLYTGGTYNMKKNKTPRLTISDTHISFFFFSINVCCYGFSFFYFIKHSVDCVALFHILRDNVKPQW